MTTATTSVPDVFTVREIALAAGVSANAVRALILGGDLGTVGGRYVPMTEAVRAVRMLRAAAAHGQAGGLFQRPPVSARAPVRGLLASGAFHAALLAGLIGLTTLGVATAPRETPQPARLVFLATAGPGGGGGGGGLRQPAPAVRAELKGDATVRSPVPPRTVRRPAPSPKPRPAPPVRPRPVERPVEPPPPAPAPVVPQVAAPVATTTADARDASGTVEAVPRDADSQGSGAGGGAGTGHGTGLGEGEGAGIGAGSGGGTGGGPYRPGSGITPPAIQREVKPAYTEEARRRGISGDVVLEIVVRRDGSVGDVQVIQGLGGGLDQRAVEAVRQWRFSPARRFGTPVDVIVEVAVEFTLR